MPFKHFLDNSIDFERTHQLVLKSLLADPDFATCLIDAPVNKDTKIYLEPHGGLFDLGLFTKEGVCLCLIELKMWSSLSKNQLDRQQEFLKKHSLKGLHILLGTTDLQYYRDMNYDEIADFTGNVSQKLGYKELIQVLNSFESANAGERTTVKMAREYRLALTKQASYLDSAWLNPHAHEHHRFYSTYSKIQTYLTEENFSIYTVNNRSGAVYIINDGGSWFGFSYKNQKFEIYQEILNNQHMIRIYSNNVPNDIRNEVKEKFLKHFKKTAHYSSDWGQEFRASKFHKIAVYNSKFASLSDCEQAAILLKKLNTVLKEFAASFANAPTA